MKSKKQKANNKNSFHRSVLLNEAIEKLNIRPGELYIDATVGGGGHAEAILKKGGRVFGLDCDQEAVEYAKKYLLKVCPAGHQSMPGLDTSWQIVKGNFVNLKEILKENKITDPAGILFDLGTSLKQLKTEGRGFSFSIDEILDMRMDKSLRVTAKDLVCALGKKELNELFKKLGEEHYSMEIARAIVRERSRKPITNTKELAGLIYRIYAGKGRIRKIHPATKVFQALRIAVNDELNNLKAVLPQAIDVLKREGRLVVISFHGLEDRIVKQGLKSAERDGLARIITKKPITPSRQELILNPRSRSAKLRCLEKL